jgi:hypothetical protein
LFCRLATERGQPHDPETGHPLEPPTPPGPGAGTGADSPKASAGTTAVAGSAATGLADASRAVRELAQRVEFAPRQADLTALADALDAGEAWDFDGWDRIDLITSFNPISTIHIEPSRRGNHALGAAAGVVMFLPLVWTWMSLHAASQAYNRLLESRPRAADGVSFLQLWVTGFGGELPARERLGTVTIVSVFLILAAIVLLVGNRWYTEGGHRHDDRRYAQAEAELATALTAAQRELAKATLSRGATPETLVLSVTKLMEAHKATSEASQRVAATVEMARTAITDAIDQVRLVSSHMAGTTSSFDRAAVAVGGAAATVERETRQALDQLASSLATAAERSGQQISAAQLQATSELGKASDGLSRVHRDLITALDDFTRSRDLTQSGFASSLASSDQARLAMSQDVAKALAAIQSLFGEMHDKLAQLEGAAERLEDTFVANTSATQSQVSELTRARDALEMLARRDFVP